MGFESFLTIAVVGEPNCGSGPYQAVSLWRFDEVASMAGGQHSTMRRFFTAKCAAALAKRRFALERKQAND